jgi:hypothetical protein
VALVPCQSVSDPDGRVSPCLDAGCSARLPHPKKPFIVTAMTAEVTSDQETYAFSLNEFYTTVPGKKSM